ncbi:hypothetical protein G6F50_014074 [Rhizopus delemar]|uniref:Uncharacterized protein n=1 Tax=Rhizopus delemar TaxID=936053 RepID=A0A9P7CA79_9FUNG|nr:hypothetical protein G6F50_014074 [Rhizopus delemar]
MDVPAQDQVDARLGPGRQRALAPDQQIGEIGFDLGAHRVVRHHDPQLARAGLAQALGHAGDLRIGNFTVLAAPGPCGVHADGQQTGVLEHGLQHRAQRIAGERQRDGHGGIAAVQPAQFGVAAQVGNAPHVGGEGARGQEPAHVAPPEAMAGGRMQILFIVGVAVMVAMVRGPPQRSALHAGGPDDSEYELHRSRRLEGAMRKIAVVERGDREHAHGIERRRNDHCGP